MKAPEREFFVVYMIISSKNLLHLNVPKTFTTNLEVAGTNVLRWKNPAGFGNSWAIQVGELGEQQTEVVILGTAAPAGTAGTLTANTLYEHPADTPIYAIKFDKQVFERSTTGTTGSTTIMTGGTITYQPNSNYTIIDDTSGSTSYTYKTFALNSAGITGGTGIETDWIYPTATGASFSSLAEIRQRVLNRPWNASFITDTIVIDDWINEWKDELTNAVIQVNENYAIGTVAIAFGTAGLGTVTSTDFKQPKRLWVTYDGVNNYVSTKMDSTDFTPQSVFVSTHPKHNWQGDNIFQVHPSDSAGTVQLVYYKLNNRLVNDTDEIPTPMKGYTSSFVDYATALIHFKDEKTDLYDRMMAKAKESKGLFLAESTPRDKTGPDYVKMTDVSSGDDV